MFSKSENELNRSILRFLESRKGSSSTSRGGIWMLIDISLSGGEFLRLLLLVRRGPETKSLGGFRRIWEKMGEGEKKGKRGFCKGKIEIDEKEEVDFAIKKIAVHRTLGFLFLFIFVN